MIEHDAKTYVSSGAAATILLPLTMRHNNLNVKTSTCKDIAIVRLPQIAVCGVTLSPSLTLRFSFSPEDNISGCIEVILATCVRVRVHRYGN